MVVDWPQDLTAFKKHGLNKVDRVIKKKYQELVKEAETLQNSLLLQEEVYASNYKFEPKIGEIYHLYEELDGSRTLSLIGPTEWSKSFLYSVILNSDMTWSKVWPSQKNGKFPRTSISSFFYILLLFYKNNNYFPLEQTTKKI